MNERLAMIKLKLHCFSASSLKIQNPFDSEISRQIRQLLEVPSEGDLMVEIIEQPGAE